MAQDDLVPDEALIVCARNLERAVRELQDVASLRSHLASPTDALSKAAFNLGAFVAGATVLAHPDDEINAKYRSRMRDEYCITASGIRFYAFDPKPEEVVHHDIVTGLVKECRYGNQIPGLRIYSVAEHSIKVAAITEHLCMLEVKEGNLHDDIIPLACLCAMLHDGHEALTGGDMPGPYKARMADAYGTPWSRVESRVQDCISEAYELPPIPVEVAQIVKQADAWMVHMEVIAFWPDKLDQFPSLKRMPPPPGDVIAVGRVKAEEPDRAMVRDVFDSEIRRLVSLVGGRIPGDKQDQRRVGRVAAAEQFAAAVQAAGIPGDRPNPPAPTPLPEHVISLERDPRKDDVTPSAWKQAVRSSSVEAPSPAAMSRLLNDPELTEDERARLAEMGGS